MVLLEQCSCKFQWDVGFVHESMSLVGISLPELFHIYDHMFKSKVHVRTYRVCVCVCEMYMCVCVCVCVCVCLCVCV